MSIPGPDPKWSQLLVKGNQVNTTAISDDGKVLLTGTSKEYGTPAPRSVYCMDSTGKTVWKDEIKEELDDGVYWVAVSGDGCYGVAGGGCFTKSGGTEKYGFLKAYDMKSGKVLLDTTFIERVNQVVMCNDGSVFAAVVNDNVRIGRLQDDGTYKMEVKTFTGDYMMSVDIARTDGNTVVVCGKNNEDYNGLLYLLTYVDGQWKQSGPWTNYHEVQQVAMLPNGQYWTASSSDGYIYYFTLKTFLDTLQPTWKYKPASPNVGSTYGLAIALDGKGNMVLGAGSNKEDWKETKKETKKENPKGTGTGNADAAGKGYVYILKFLPDATTAPTSEYFNASLTYDPNPGLHFDGTAQYMTATDGEPSGKVETPGNFYLFDVNEKKQLWVKDTVIMNWPMAINAKGTAIFGGGDDGFVYYWGAPS